ncbi:MAG TPA: hypothetical protein VKP67_11040 [Xanthobacteraceae bacterium]|nr:hypothetical protein [Xanthobacteraceae bacterium]
MATDEPTGTHVKTLSVREAQALADRLHGRSVSTLSTASDQERRDLLLASRVIRTLVHAIDRVAAQADDTVRTLRNLKIDVGG